MKFAVFAAIGIAGLGLTSCALYVLVDFIGIAYRATKIAAAALVFLFNFGCRKFFLSRPARNR